MTDSVDARSHRLLAAFTNDERARCRPWVGLTERRVGQAMSRAGVPSAHLYVPSSAIVSLPYASCEAEPPELDQAWMLLPPRAEVGRQAEVRERNALLQDH